jgi:protein-arginine kinase
LIVIDPEGYAIACISGEGKRDVLDQLIAQVISEHREKKTINFQQLSLTLEKQRQLLNHWLFPVKF